MRGGLNIVFVCNHFLPSIGGVELSVHHTATALAIRGHKVTIVAEGEHSPPAAVDTPYEIIRVSVPNRYPLTRLWYWKKMWDLRSTFRSADIVHFHDYIPLIHWYLPLWFLIRSPLYAITYHGFESWPILFRYQFFRVIASSLCDVRFGVGEYLGKYYTHSIDRYFVGASVRTAAVETLTKANHIVTYIGRLEPDTQIYQVLEQMKYYAESHREVFRLESVGIGALSDAITNLGSEYFQIHVHQPTLEVEPYLQSCGVVIATGFLAVFDALASGRHVLIPAYTELKQDYFRSIPGIEEAAFVITSQSQLTNAMSEIRNNSQVARRKIKAAEGILKENTWANIAALHERQYIQAFDNRPAGQLSGIA